MNVQCENCSAHFQIGAGDISGATACPDCGGTRFYRSQPSPTRSDGTLRNMVDSDSQKDQGGNPLGEGTIMGRDGEVPLNTGTRGRDNYMHSNILVALAAGWGGNDPFEQGHLRCPNCGGEIISDPQSGDIFCSHCDHSWPVYNEMRPIDRHLEGDTLHDLYQVPDVPSGQWTQEIPRHQGKIGAQYPDEEGYNGWTNHDTWHTKLMMDNEQHFAEEQERMAREGWSPEQIRDWAIHHVIGPHNAQQISDAQEWNAIPQEERLDPHFEELKNRSPQAADIVDSMGFGPDVADSQPQLLDPEMVNWNEIHHNIHHDYHENQAYERGEDPADYWRRLNEQERGVSDQSPGDTTFPKEWTGRIAGEMEDILGLNPQPVPQGNFMRWQPGIQGRGLVINGEPHTWPVYHPNVVGDESHSGYIKKLGINPSLVDLNSQVEIHPTGEVEALAGRDPMPYINADPRLKPLREDNGDIFSIQPTMQPISRSLSMDPYTPWEHQADVQFDKGPDANVPQHTITVQPGPLGIHAGHTKYLRFLDAHVNGIPARSRAGEIISHYGLHDSPEFGQPVQIGVHDPAHIAPIVEQIQSSQGAVATPLMKELGHKIQSGQLPPPPGIDPASIAPVQQAVPEQQAEVPVTARTAGPALAIGGEALLGGGAEAAGGAAAGEGGGMLSGGLGGIAPALMKGALFRQGENLIGGGSGNSPAQAPTGEGAGGSAGPPELSQIAAILVADYETPSSNPDVGTKHDDPEDVDQKEFNDKESDPNPKNPNLEDSGASGEDEVRDHAGFGPDSPGIERLGLLLPLVLHFFHSGNESGADDPMIKGLHDILESENPGYLDRVTPEDEQKAKQFIDQLGTHQHDTKQGKVALVPPMQNGYMDPMFMQQQQEGQMPTAIMPPGGTQQQGHCPNCGGVLTADGSCPQCGAKQNPMGGSTLPGQTPMSGGPSMPPAMAHNDILAALVDSANHQGPITPEQIAAVQQLLIKEHRVHEVPNVPLEPANYAREMAEIQQNPNVVPQVPQGEQTSPPAPAMGGAPGGMPMPGMAPGETGGAPMQPMAHIAADNIAKRCPKCKSATTGMLMDEGNHQICHSCGEMWKAEDAVADKSVNKETRIAGPAEATPDQTQHPQNPIDAPAAEQHHPRDIGKEQDSSLSWKDTEGNPLLANQEYEMWNPSYEMPDMIRVNRIKPDGLDITILGIHSNEPNALQAEHTISREEMQLEHLNFVPAVENADDRNNQVPPGSQTPGDAQMPPSGQTTDEVANSNHQITPQSNVNHDVFFGGAAGAAQRALAAMEREYGNEKGHAVYAALIKEKQAKSITPADIRHAEMLATAAQSNGQVITNINDIPEFVDDDSCPKCGNLRIEASMSSPTTMMHDCFRCGHVWETRDEMPDYGGSVDARSWVMESNGPGGDDFFSEMERARAMASANSMGSRNLSDIASKDARQQQIKDFLDGESERLGSLGERISGKKFTPQEQRALIDENGKARNSDMLQLGGTHYRTRDNYTANGANVPASHLIMGV